MASATSVAAPLRRTRPSRAEQLFVALDGRDLHVSGEAWHLEVYSVCEQAGRRWIQLAIDGPQHYMLTLALATGSGVSQAVRTLSGWLARPDEAHDVLHVA
jgi:predicted secreted hydrolase